MIGLLSGTLAERSASGAVVVDVGGVGYDVSVTGPTSVSLGQLGSKVQLRIHTRVREDAITLYGFATTAEKECFEALIGAHGVGPSMALALLTMHSPISLRQIVAMEDTDALSQVPGIGKKTAARLLMELKAKFDLDADAQLVNLSSDTTAAESSARADVIVALTNLGYSGDEIRRVLSNMPSDGSAEEMLRNALRELVTA